MTAQGFESHHFKDNSGRPEGGVTFGTGFTVSWRRGPLGRGEDRKRPNGAFVEDVIGAARDRIEFYNSSQFRCAENEEAIRALDRALEWLEGRTARREAEGVEGTHEGN